MNASIKELPTYSNMPIAMGYSGTISHIEKDKNITIYRISTANGMQWHAQHAPSLLVSPEVGDLVICTLAADQYFVTQILQRSSMVNSLKIHSTKPVEWIVPSIRFKAFDEIELQALNKVCLSAQNIVNAASKTFVQQADNFLQQAKNFALTTKGLMQLKGRQQIVIAEEDLRMDAKRINMG